MKLFVIRESYFLNIVILLVSFFISLFCFLSGIEHLIKTDFNNLELSDVYGAIIPLFLGAISLLVVIASIKGIIYKIKNNSNK